MMIWIYFKNPKKQLRLLILLLSLFTNGIEENAIIAQTQKLFVYEKGLEIMNLDYHGRYIICFGILSFK